MAHRWVARAWPERRGLGHRFRPALSPVWQPPGLRFPLRSGRRRRDLPARLPLMLTLIIFIPLLAALAILLGAPARKTAVGAAIAHFTLTVLAFLSYDKAKGGFQ